MELRVSLDEREDPDEEQEIEVEGIPFVVNEDVIDSYGLKYTIAVDEHNSRGQFGIAEGQPRAGIRWRLFRRESLLPVISADNGFL